MSRSPTRYVVYVALLVVYLLHNDLWLWDDPSIVLGLPVGLTYHVGYSLLAALMMFLLVRHAWPEELEAMDDVEAPGSHGIPTVDELLEDAVESRPEAPGSSGPDAPGESGADVPGGPGPDPSDRGSGR